MNQKTDSKSVNWKGDNVSYWQKHRHITRHFGNPEKCEKCGVQGKSNKGGRWTIQWANISGTYKRIVEDYKGLCTKCHKVFDGLKKHFEHGLMAKYKEGCRCELCKKAKHMYRNKLLDYSRIVSSAKCWNK